MKSKRLNNQGFTLIELIMVIVILGILAVVALPRFANLQGSAQDAAEQGVVGGVRSGIAVQYAQVLADAIAGNDNYPATLDATAVGACATATPCFGTVLDQGGVTSGGWSKLAAAAGFEGTYQHVGSNTSTYNYESTDGSFVCSGAACP